MELKNQIMLITYGDSLGQNLAELHSLLGECFEGAVGGVHLLPFYPSSADRGFAPISYREVDPKLGTWEDIERLGRDYYLMFDYMINHISRQSPYFQDFIQNKESSPYKNLFIRYKDFWPGGAPTQAQVDEIYKRKPRAPYVEVNFADGSREKIWCTFDEEQIDLDCRHEDTQRFNAENLRFLTGQGASVIRLDAFAYATKKVGSNCFFVEPDVWNLLDECNATLRESGAILLPEIHEHYSMQLKVAQKGYPVYDFALPMLLLHALYAGESRNLQRWFSICPRNQFTTLDTHDGIGVVDARDLMSEEEIEYTRTRLYQQGGTVKKVYNSAAYNNLDIYQINCTYYSALGEDDDAYLLARAIQFFAPGIPQVYYVGMMAGPNDVELVERTRVGRDINRHYYTAQEVRNEMRQRPVLQRLLGLMRFRNTHPAFNGEFSCAASGASLCMQWENGEHCAQLKADLKNHSMQIQMLDEGKMVPFVSPG